MFVRKNNQLQKIFKQIENKLFRLFSDINNYGNYTNLNLQELSFIIMYEVTLLNVTGNLQFGSNPVERLFII